MARTASNWYPSVAAPDLSNLLRLAGRTGRLEGSNDAMDDILEYRADKILEREKERAKKEKEAAKKDLGDDPESEGFWSRLADMAGEGLERGIDLLSRFNYASANAADYLVDQDEDRGDQDHKTIWDALTGPGIFTGGVSGADILEDLNLGDIGGVANAAWQGFSGKDKTTFAEVIKKGAQHNDSDNIFDSSIYQGVAGLTGDILLDPTTYVGVGIVSKPLKSALSEPKIDDELIKGIEGLGITRKGMDDEGNFVDVPLSSDEIRTFLGERTNTPRPKGGRELRKWRESQTMKGRHRRISTSQDVADTRRKVQFLSKVREKLNSGEVKVPQHLLDEAQDTSKYYDNLIKQVDDELKKTTQRYAKRVYRDTLKSMANKGMVDADISVKATRVWNEAVDLSKVTEAFQHHVFHKVAKKKGRTPTNPHFHDAMGDAWKKDPRLSDIDRDQALSIAEKLSKQDKFFIRTMNKLHNKSSGLLAQEKRLQYQLTKAESGSEEFSRIRSQLAKVKRAREEAYRDLNRIRAANFKKTVEHMLTRGSDEFAELTAREAEIRKELSKLPSEVDSPDTPVGSIDLRNELKEIEDRKAELIRRGTPDKALETPPGAPEDVREILQFDKSGNITVRENVPEELRGWAEQVARWVDLEQDTILERKISTWRRRAREKRAEKLKSEHQATAAKLKEMFKDDSPAIKLNGKILRKSDRKAVKEQLAKWVTDADRAKYRKEAKESKNKVVEDESGSKDSVPVKNKANPVSTEDAVKDSQAVKTGFAAQSLTDNAFDRLFKDQHGMSVNAASKMRKTHKVDLEVPKDYDPTIPASEKQEMIRESADEAARKANEHLEEGTLPALGEGTLNLRGSEPITIEHTYKVASQQAKEEYAQKIADAKAANPGPRSNAAKLKAEVDRIKKERDEVLDALRTSYRETIKTEKAAAERLREQLVLDSITENVTEGKNYVRISGAGLKLVDIPSPVALTKATEKLSGLPILQKAYNTWSEAFKPASKLEPELNIARLRAQARTPDIIKHHLDDLMTKFSEFKPTERAHALKVLRKGKPPVGDLETRMHEFFTNYSKYTSGSYTLDGEPLTIRELNRYLPEEFHFIPKNSADSVNELSLTNPEEIISAMRRLDPDEDAMKVMWRLQIAAEQALAYKALQSTVRKTFGVKRIIRRSKDEEEPSELEVLIESLHKDHEWKTVRDMGEEYYFPPEMAEQIQDLMKITKPEQTQEMMRVYDKAMRAWKSAVTVYNLGYYSRNGIGEVIMSALDGLFDPRYYSKAAQWVNYSAPDHVKEVLKTLEPWKRHRLSSKAQRGAKAAVTLKGGKKLTLEDIDVLYHEVGLKSGFVSTEYDHYVPAANTMRATAVGQVARNINDKVRDKGEKFEDFFRVAHFMYRMERSGLRDPLAAAHEAAEYVRKYHFDYTDFTPFEKTKMMRIFPFYKWTRKAFPLMASMIFTKPAGVTFYPKAMSAISYATGATDPLKDQNGFLPNYEKVTPEWMRAMFSYPIGRDAEGNMDYMNVATPAMDVYKLMQDPASAVLGMLTPGFKVPMEQLTGETMDPNFKMPVETKGERAEHLARQTPLGSLINNIRKGSAEGEDSAVFEAPNRLDEKLTSFLSGLGFYENNEDRKKGEQYRRFLETKDE